MNNSHTSPTVVLRARELRRQPTPAENALWGRLRNRQLEGLKFRCQSPIGRYIVDFSCPARGLVVEIDGSSHQGRDAVDLERTPWLEAQGLRVLRFSNTEVMVDAERVLAEIARACGCVKGDETPGRPRSSPPGPLREDGLGAKQVFVEDD